VVVVGSRRSKVISRGSKLFLMETKVNDKTRMEGECSTLLNLEGDSDFT
jgi:hypothetical protein